MTDLETILSWFQTGDMPTEEEFQETFSSFRLKNKKIPIAEVDGLESSLNKKLNISDIPTNMALVDEGQPKDVFNKEQITAMTMMLSDYVKDGKIRADKIEKLGLTDVGDMVKSMGLATDSQKDAWRLSQRKTNESYSLAQPRIDTISPPYVDGSKDYTQYITLMGLNLFINSAVSTVYLYKYIDSVGNVVANPVMIPINYFEVNQQMPSLLTFGLNFENFEAGQYKVKVINNGLESLDSPLIIITPTLNEIPLPQLAWQKSIDFDNKVDTISLDESSAFITTKFHNDSGAQVYLQSSNNLITPQEASDGVIIKMSTSFTSAYDDRLSVGFGLSDNAQFNQAWITDFSFKYYGSKNLIYSNNVIYSGVGADGTSFARTFSDNMYIIVYKGVVKIFFEKLGLVSSQIINVNNGLKIALYLTVWGSEFKTSVFISNLKKYSLK